MIAEEIHAAVRAILGTDIELQCLLTHEIQTNCPGDLFVCGPTQFNSLAQTISVEKIVVLTLTPTSQFYVQLARIPAGAVVHVFNNRMEYTRILAENCRNVGLTELRFVSVAYDEMSEDEVRAELQRAQYIIGVDNQVGVEILLTRFESCLKSDVQIIGAKRVVSLASACGFIQRLAMLLQEDLAGRLTDIIQQLRVTVETPVTNDYAQGFQQIARELGMLAQAAASSAETISKTVTNSITSQIKPGQPKNETAE